MENLYKSEFLEIILKQNENVTLLTKQVKQLMDVIKRQEPEKPRDFNALDKISKPSPEKSVKQMVKKYEENIITPVPPPRTKIKQVNQACLAMAPLIVEEL